MWAMTDQMAQAIRNPFRAVSKIDLYGSSRTILSGPSAEINNTLLQGSVSVNVDAAVRRRLSLTLTTRDQSLIPAFASDPLSPYGNEIKPYSGVLYPDGTRDYVPLGVFRISRSTVTDDGAGKITIAIDGYDRARSISRNRFSGTWQVDEAANIGTAIQTLLDNRLGGIKYRFAQTPHTANYAIYEPQSDPWDIAMKMAHSIGMDLFFDNDGVCVMEPVRDAVGVEAEWVYNTGEPDGVLITTESTFDDDDGFSAVTVIGESINLESGPVSATVYDSNPFSPTYYLGPYGIVTKFVNSQLYGSPEQCEDAARRLILKATGATQTIGFTSLINPAHEGYDIVQISNPNIRVSDIYLLDSFTIPIGVGSMSATARKVALVGDEL